MKLDRYTITMLVTFVCATPIIQTSKMATTTLKQNDEHLQELEIAAIKTIKFGALVIAISLFNIMVLTGPIETRNLLDPKTCQDQ